MQFLCFQIDFIKGFQSTYFDNSLSPDTPGSINVNPQHLLYKSLSRQRVSKMKPG